MRKSDYKDDEKNDEKKWWKNDEKNDKKLWKKWWKKSDYNSLTKKKIWLQQSPTTHHFPLVNNLTITVWL